MRLILIFVIKTRNETSFRKPNNNSCPVCDYKNLLSDNFYEFYGQQKTIKCTELLAAAVRHTFYFKNVFQGLVYISGDHIC
jgi:hypothetical protein